MRFDWSNSQILELLRPLCRSAGDFEINCDCCAALPDAQRAAETSAQCWSRLGAILRQQWFLHNYKALRLIIFVCYSHKIHYILLWHASFNSLSIYTHGQSGSRWFSSIIRGASGHSHCENSRCATWRPLWWSNGARTQRVHHLHSAAPLATSKQHS